LAASGIVTFQSSSNPNSRNFATSGLIYNEGTAGNAGFEFKNTTSGSFGYFTIETGDIQQFSMNGGQTFYAGGGLVLKVAPVATSATGTLSSTGVLSTSDTTDASSTTAAALKTAGGFAVVKKIYVGDNVVPAAAKGMNFSGNTPAAGMTSQLLNWYEEGTWTPADVSGAGLSLTTAQSRYTRIGRLVQASFILTYPVTASALQNYISLPINSNYGGGMYVAYTTYGLPISGYIDGTNNRFVIVDFAGTPLTNANLSTKRIDGVLTYQAA
jgi:hypothetical protein